MSAINGTTHTVEGERSTLRSSYNMKVVVKVPLIKGMHAVFTVSCSGTLQISKLIKLGTVGQQTASVSMTLVSMFWPRWLFKFADLEFMHMWMLTASVVSHRTHPCSLLSTISMFFCCKLISFLPFWSGYRPSRQQEVSAAVLPTSTLSQTCRTCSLKRYCFLWPAS